MRFPFSRLVVWGGRSDLHSHAHIHRHFFETAQKLRVRTVWVEDERASNDALDAGALVLAADVWSRHIEPRPGVSYVLHNFDGGHPLCRSLESSPERLLRLQVWSRDAYGESWGPARAFARASRTLFQPWGTDLLAEEFLDPVANTGSQEVVFVGSIWSELSADGELGNAAVIDELREALASRGLRLRHLAHVSDEENALAVRGSRLAPAVAGAWQVAHDYLPCRAFKNVSYGQLALSNVPAFNRLLVGCSLEADTVAALLDTALALRPDELDELVHAQQLAVCSYTYRESLEAIARAFEEITR